MASGTISVTVELVGAYAGKTIILNNHQFVKGRCDLIGSPDGVAYTIAYLQRSYGAYPIGSKEFLAAKEAVDGRSDLSEKTESNVEVPRPVRSDFRLDGGQSVETETDVKSGHDEPARESEGRTDGGGDRHSDSWVPTPKVEPAFEGASSEPNEQVRKIVYSLDYANDSHWTKAGLPKLSVIESAYGRADVTREMVESAVPGWTRDKAKELHDLEYGTETQ